MREQLMMYGVLLPDPNLGRYNYNTVHFPRQRLGGAILLTSFCLQDRLIISTGNLYQKRKCLLGSSAKSVYFIN